MALVMKGDVGSDDEDLECLRMAALQSLKRQAPVAPVVPQHRPVHVQPHPATFGSAQPTRHHARTFRGANRQGRNGRFPAARNTNLISIKTVDSDSDNLTSVKKPVEEDCPKLILPQDRYHKVDESKETTKEAPSNKFDRYDNSDNSDSDDNSDAEAKRNDREDSLERLMEELEDEIHERSDKPKKKKEDSEKTDENCDTNSNEAEVTKEEDGLLLLDCDDLDVEEDDILQEKVEIKEEKPKEILKEEVKSPERREKPKLEKRSPIRKSPFARRKTRSRSRSPRRYESRRDSRSPPRKIPYESHYPRPLSPLTINTEVLSSMTRAPLSPRSAAFVLQNREILARRKMSPRKSPSPRHSLSPRRRSRSPWFDYSHKRSLSPRGRSPRSFSPRRRSMSPRRRRSPKEERRVENLKRSRSPPRQPVHKRLGAQRTSPIREKKPESRKRNRSISLSLSPSPDRSYNRHPLNDTTGTVKLETRQRDRPRERPRKETTPEKKPEKELDPVLEARRRKFENPVQVGQANGIIKLKKTEDEAKVEVKEAYEEEVMEQEEEVEDLIDLNPTVDDLWSDEESDNENEGRFKSTSKEQRTVTCLPFTKLTERPVANKVLTNARENERNRERKHESRPRSRRERPKDIDKEVKTKIRLVDTKPDSTKRKEIRIKENIERNTEKSLDKILEKPEKRSVERNVEKVEKKPSLERNVEKIDKPVEEVRKVKIPKVEELEKEKISEDDDDDTEIIIENDDDDDEDDSEIKDDGGDLRAELSRRRAQRLYKAGSLSEVLPSRLLKTALKEVGLKRTSKHSKVEKSGVANSLDRRVLVLKRLASSPEPELDTKIKEFKKESGKLPIHMRLGVSGVQPELDDVLHGESGRLRKKSRPGRRKRGVQV